MADHGSGALPLHAARPPELQRAQARDVLHAMLAAAINAADPFRILAPHLPPPPVGRCIAIGAGKAAASMAAALERAWPDANLSGIVAVPYGYGLDCKRISVREAGHPVPDANSVAAARAIVEAVQGLQSDDLVVALISGGGSAAMCLPAPGITLEDKQIANRLLLASGLDIRTMNSVRRRISAIKGGKLAAAAAPAQVVTLAISDIPGDDTGAIASGPTVADPGFGTDLRNVVERLGPTLPAAVRAQLCLPGEEVECANARDFRLIATPAQALDAAAAIARDHGVAPIMLGDDIEGESCVVAERMAGMVAGISEPTVLISGGETTVTLEKGAGGRGGRNTEFALALACQLQGRADVFALAADTDGEDGANLGAAGAFISPDTLDRARSLGLDPTAFLEAHDSGSFFAALGDLVRTGPTRTNVNDFRAILVLPSQQP